MSNPSSLLRDRSANTQARVTFVELFFDLVFVFAVTQLSHTLLEHLSLEGVVHTTMLLLAVWWVWIYTCWFTNWLDPDRPSVRAVIFLLMLAGLLLSAAIPHAFSGEGLLFASAYVGMQLLRTVFMINAMRGVDEASYRNFQRIFAWTALSAVFWFAGALSYDGARVAWWLLALFIEYLSPAVSFYVPGLGSSTTMDWNIDGGHMAERCALFIIIALGESILVTGTTTAAQPATLDATLGFVIAFVGSLAMWWIYFNIGVERGRHKIAHSSDPGRIARAVYTYAHLPIAAGIVVCAVADELVIKHPMEAVTMAEASAVVGGPGLYLIGNLFFKRASTRYFPLSHLVGLGALVPIGLFYWAMPALLLGFATTATLVMVAVWETLSLRSPRPDAA